MAAVPALVGDLRLHHPELGGRDVGPARAGQDGVQLLLLLLGWRLFACGLPIGWGRRPAPPPEVLPVPAGVAFVAVPVSVLVPISEEEVS